MNIPPVFGEDGWYDGETGEPVRGSEMGAQGPIDFLRSDRRDIDQLKAQVEEIREALEFVLNGTAPMLHERWCLERQEEGMKVRELLACDRCGAKRVRKFP